MPPSSCIFHPTRASRLSERERERERERNIDPDRPARPHIRAIQDSQNSRVWKGERERWEKERERTRERERERDERETKDGVCSLFLLLERRARPKCSPPHWYLLSLSLSISLSLSLSLSRYLSIDSPSEL